MIWIIFLMNYETLFVLINPFTSLINYKTFLYSNNQIYQQNNDKMTLLRRDLIIMDLL